MTNEEINALTDQQINVMMTATVYGLSDFYEKGVFTKGKNKIDGTVDSVMTEDYCNDHAVMMPIVFDCGISLSFCRKQSVWFAADDAIKPRHSHFNTNPLRAAAIVYLKMKGVL